MTQPPPPNQPWDPNAGGPGYGYPPQQQPPAYGAPPPGYNAPPPGYNPPPQGGYGPPPPAGPPPGYPSSEDKTYALVAHFGGAVGTLISGGVLAFVGPLIALLARGNQSPVVKEHARNALNFFIPVAGAGLLLLIGRLCADAVLSFG